MPPAALGHHANRSRVQCGRPSFVLRSCCVLSLAIGCSSSESVDLGHQATSVQWTDDRTIAVLWDESTDENEGQSHVTLIDAERRRVVSDRPLGFFALAGLESSGDRLLGFRNGRSAHHVETWSWDRNTDEVSSVRTTPCVNALVTIDSRTGGVLELDPGGVRLVVNEREVWRYGRPGEDEGVECVDFRLAKATSDGWIVAITDDEVLRWRLELGSGREPERARLPSQDESGEWSRSRVVGMRESGDARVLVLRVSDGVGAVGFMCADLRGEAPLLWSIDPSHTLRGADVSGDGNVIGVISADRGVEFWSTLTRRVVGTRSLSGRAPTWIAISPGGRRCAVATKDGDLVILETDLR